MLRAFTLNCWCIGYVPESLNGSKDIVCRVAAIAEFLSRPQSDFDFVFLQVLQKYFYLFECVCLSVCLLDLVP